jgi:hypothetical protein
MELMDIEKVEDEKTEEEEKEEVAEKGRDQGRCRRI